MRVLVISLLASLACAMEIPDAETVNQLLDVVESGLDNSREGRQLFITLSLTSTATARQTVTLSSTLTRSCVSTASPITTCTATTTTTTTTGSAAGTNTTTTAATTNTTAATTNTTVAAGRRQRSLWRLGRSAQADEEVESHEDNEAVETVEAVEAVAEEQVSEETTEVKAEEVATTEAPVEVQPYSAFEETRPVVYQSFPEAIVTRDDGVIVDIETILPTRVQVGRQGFDFDQFDGVFVDNSEGLSSGKIEWREVAVQGRSAETCNARSALDRRPRFVVLSTGTVTITSTSFSTNLVTAPNTVTFQVSQITCTSSGFSFAVPAC